MTCRVTAGVAFLLAALAAPALADQDQPMDAGDAVPRHPLEALNRKLFE